MKILFTSIAIVACLSGFTACESDEVSPTVHTSTTTEESLVRPSASATTETRTIRSY